MADRLNQRGPPSKHHMGPSAAYGDEGRRQQDDERLPAAASHPPVCYRDHRDHCPPPQAVGSTAAETNTTTSLGHHGSHPPPRCQIWPREPGAILTNRSGGGRRKEGWRHPVTSTQLLRPEPLPTTGLRRLPTADDRSSRSDLPLDG
jgi:hypothetical protein